jgi:hypothetical protein
MFTYYLVNIEKYLGFLLPQLTGGDQMSASNRTCSQLDKWGGVGVSAFFIQTGYTHSETRGPVRLNT